MIRLDNLNRMKCMRQFLGNQPGAGDLTVKNLLEAAAGRKLVRFTKEELADLPEGNGASEFWSEG